MIRGGERNVYTQSWKVHQGPTVCSQYNRPQMSLIARIREPFNALSHAAGAVIVGVGAFLLAVLALSSPLAALAFAVFGLGAVFMFTSSALYHWLKLEHQWLQRMDHCAIYVMIAGSYTPIALLALPKTLGMWVLALQWGMAVVGILVAATREKTPTPLRLSLYLGMGWMCAFLLPQMLAATSPTTLGWMIGGGLFYTVGAVIYASKRPNLWPGRFGFHELWHIFVLGGALCHLMVMVTLFRMLG